MVAAPAPRSSRAASAGLRYLTDGQAHDGTDKPRSWFVDGLDCMPETAEQEWQAVRQRYGKDGVRERKDAKGQPMTRADGSPQMEGSYVQAVHLVMSYDPSEYDPEDVEAIQKAHEQSKEVAERIRAGHQVVLATQTDGQGSNGVGKVHTHIYMNAVHPETGRSANGRHPAKDIQQLRRTVDEVSLEHGRDNKALMAQRDRSLRLTPQEIQRQQDGEYVWKQDLHERLDTAMSGATNRDEWREAAEAEGVEIKFRGKSGVSYAMTDAEGEDRKIRARQLGSHWMARNVDVQLEANRTLAAEKERIEREEAEKARLAAEQAEQERLAAEQAAAWDFEVTDSRSLQEVIEDRQRQQDRGVDTSVMQDMQAAEDGWNFEVADTRGFREVIADRKTARENERERARWTSRSRDDDYGMEL